MSLIRQLSAGAIIAVLAGCVASPPPETPRSPPPAQVPPASPPPGPVGPKPVSEPPPLSPLAAPTTGGVAFYQTRQEQQLRERLDRSGIRIARVGDTLRLMLPANAAFSASGDQLQPRFVDSLTTVALVLREYTKTTIEIKGYTDSTGSFEHNQDLSARRAQAVGSFFIARQIAPARIHTAGYGPRYPVADNKTDAGRAQNRRVEIELVPTP